MHEVFTYLLHGLQSQRLQFMQPDSKFVTVTTFDSDIFSDIKLTGAPCRNLTWHLSFGFGCDVQIISSCALLGAEVPQLVMQDAE